MADRYTAYGLQTVASPKDTTMTLTTSMTGDVKRAKLYEMVIGVWSGPVDASLRHTVQRCSDYGAGSVYYGISLDYDAPSSGMDVRYRHTSEPTYLSGNMALSMTVNHRATFRWVASPGAEIMIPAVAGYGVGVYSEDVVAVVTPEIITTIYWME